MQQEHTEEEIIRSAADSDVASPTNKKKQPVAKIKGHQLVGSQEIDVAELSGDESNKDDTQLRNEAKGDDEVRGSGGSRSGSNSDTDSSGSVDSAKMRARDSAMTIDTRKSPEEEKMLGDQKVIEVETGPIFD